MSASAFSPSLRFILSYSPDPPLIPMSAHMRGARACARSYTSRRDSKIMLTAHTRYLTTLFLTTRLGVLNMPCRVGIAIPEPLYTRGLLANCGRPTCLGQLGNRHYTVYHYLHLVNKPPTIFSFCLFIRHQLPVLQST